MSGTGFAIDLHSAPHKGKQAISLQGRPPLPACWRPRPKICLPCRERNDGLYRPITYVIFKMMEEISITLINSLVFSSIVFFPLKLTGDFILFWLLNLTTTSIGIGE